MAVYRDPQGNPVPLTADYQSAASRLWSRIDARVMSLVTGHVQQNLGVARPRGMTMAVPLAGTTTPTTGWLTSIPIFQPVRITAWLIHALVSGTIQIDLQVSQVQPSPATAPTLISLINGPAPISPVYLSLTGYTTVAYDTQSWYQREVQAFSVINVFVHSATSVQQAVLGLQLQDLLGRTLQA